VGSGYLSDIFCDKGSVDVSFKCIFASWVQVDACTDVEPLGLEAVAQPADSTKGVDDPNFHAACLPEIWTNVDEALEYVRGLLRGGWQARFGEYLVRLSKWILWIKKSARFSWVA
jgi:hypothetical protein